MSHRKIVLITGSSRGIGLAAAERFAMEGYTTVLNCRKDISGMEAAEARLKKINSSIIGIPADVSDIAEVRKMFDQIDRSLGPVDILVNNAGAAHFGLFQDTDAEDWDAVLRANLYSVLNCCKLAIPNMVSRKSGAIVNVSSIWGISGASCESVYSAAKGGVNSFTKALAKELGPCGIRVNAIACGAIETDMNARLSLEEREAFAEGIPMSRFGSPEEAASLIYFLASEEASYVNGQVITLDGGLL